MWNAPEPPDPGTDGSGRGELSIGSAWAMAIVLAAVAALSILALVALADRRSDEEHVVAVIRQEQPTLSPEVISDAELIALARRSCGPEGLSAADRRMLTRLGIEDSDIRDEALALCPQR